MGLTQKTVQLTKKYLSIISSKGHEKCFKCKIKFKVEDKVHGIIRNTGRGQSKFYHEDCYWETCH